MYIYKCYLKRSNKRTRTNLHINMRFIGTRCLYVMTNDKYNIKCILIYIIILLRYRVIPTFTIVNFRINLSLAAVLNNKYYIILCEKNNNIKKDFFFFCKVNKSHDWCLYLYNILQI